MTGRVVNTMAALGLLVSALGAVGCGPGAPTLTATPPTPAASASTKPSDATFDQAAWQQVVASAKREGRLVILGPSGADAREGFVAEFQKRYPEINIDYTGAFGTQHAPKLLTERQAGNYSADLYIGGTTTALTDFIPTGSLEPVQPFLVGPEARDTAKWLGGKFDFADNDERHNLVFVGAVKAPVIYNPSAVTEGDIKSFRDLLEPKWRGKVTMFDPRVAGPGLAQVTFMYAEPSLGPEYLRQLFGSGIVLTRDFTQMVDSVARGEYPLGTGQDDGATQEAIKKGVRIGLLAASSVKEGSYLTPIQGSVAVIERAPHPNATKLYLDWLLSREAQTSISRACGCPSRRLDVPGDHLNKAILPQAGVQYQENYKEPYVRLREEIQGFLQANLPR